MSDLQACARCGASFPPDPRHPGYPDRHYCVPPVTADDHRGLFRGILAGLLIMAVAALIVYALVTL